MTLGEFKIPVPLTCFYCDKSLPKKSKADIDGKWLIVECPTCKCATAFKAAGKVQ